MYFDRASAARFALMTLPFFAGSALADAGSSPEQLNTAAVAEAALGLVENEPGVQVVHVVGLPRGSEAKHMERAVAGALQKRNAIVAVVTSADVASTVTPAAGTDFQTLAKAGAEMGADHTVVLRVMPNGGEVLVQLANLSGNLRSALVRVGPAFSLSDDADDPRQASLDVFKTRALRLKARPKSNDLWLPRGVTAPPEFNAWTGEGKKLDRVEMLETAGQADLATRQHLLEKVGVWTLPVSLLVMCAVMAGGFAGGMVVGLAAPGAILPIPSSGAGLAPGIEQGLLLGLLGMLGGVVVPLAMLIVEPGISLFKVDDDETLEFIQAHNKKVARDVGLPKGDIPEAYLSY